MFEIAVIVGILYLIGIFYEDPEVKNIRKTTQVTVENVCYVDGNIVGDLTIEFNGALDKEIKDFEIYFQGYSKTDTVISTNLDGPLLIVYEKTKGETINVKKFSFGPINPYVSKIKCHINGYKKC